MPGEGRVGEERLKPPGILAASLFVLLCDQASKLIAMAAMSQGSSIPVIPDIFHLTLVFNKGAAFGMLKDRGGLFIFIGVAAVVLLLAYLPKVKRKDITSKAAFTLVLAGILGNLIDRIRLGFVIDFLDLRVWPVFNIADSAITIGVVLICLRLLRRRRTKNNNCDW